MFKDRDDALKRMEQQLLEEEAYWDEDFLEEFDEDEDDLYEDVYGAPMPEPQVYTSAQNGYVGRFERKSPETYSGRYEAPQVYAEQPPEYLDDPELLDEPEEGGDGSLLGLSLLAIGLMAGILAVAAYWVFRFL